MTNLTNSSQPPNQQPAGQHPPGSGNATVPRNVSFARDSNESNAYREHNPPTVLRRQEAARRDMSPSAEAVSNGGGAFPTQGANFQLDPEEYADRLSQRSRNPSASSVNYGNVTHSEPKTKFADAPPPTGGRSGTQTPRFSTPEATGAPKQGALKYGGSKRAGRRSELPSLQTSSLYNPNQTGNPASAGSEKVEPNKQNEVHILVAVTGSVATIKLPLIVRKLKQTYRKSAIIQVVVTRAATTFFDPKDLPRDIKVWHDSDEWMSRQAPSSAAETHSDKQLHIQLRRWADILLVAPCSANTLAKFTYGICDNLLTSIFRVWNPEVPILLAPAMNTYMYTNPVTKLHFNVLKEFYPFVEILKPVEKVLVCGDIGMGGMREWTDIVQILTKRIGVDLDEEDDLDSDEEGSQRA